MVLNAILLAAQLVSAYQVKTLPTSLLPTGATASGAVKAYGEVRDVKGHPSTTWDATDVKRFRAMMKTSPELRTQADALRRAMDRRLLQPLGIPEPQKGPDGEWIHISDTKVGKIHNALSLDIANLGTCYQLFGDEKYAEFCKRLLLAYADAWPKYGVGARPTFRHDPSKVFDQRLSDATWLIQIAIGYDFIHDYPGITPAERAHIEKDLVAADAYFICQNRAHLRNATNWSAIGTTAVLAAGYACDDRELINTALFGVNWLDRRDRAGKETYPNRWWEGTPNAHPSGVELHFSEKCIDVDGMWTEGAMGYQFMALQALVCDAEILRHHGIDLYRYRNSAMKNLFDSPILFAYPTLISPAIHDSHNSDIVGREAYLYEYGYLNYRDPKYLEILRRIDRRLAASFQQFTVSTLYDVDVGKAGEVVAPANVNLNGVGYGILRQTDAKGTRSLLLDYGPNRSHGHPDKLNIDLWGFGELLVPDPGCTWYEKPIYRNWYRTTFAHNTLSVDMQEQAPCGAELLVYAPGGQAGIMRGRTDGAYAGVMMDRSLFLTARYLADLFGAFGETTHTYDLAWHPRGICTKVARLGTAVDFALPEPRPAGYSELKDLRANQTRDTFRAEFTTAGGRKTALIAPDGVEETLFVTAKAEIEKNSETPVFERRRVTSTVFGNVFTFDGSVPMVKQGGGVEKGYSLLTIQGGGIDDTCYASFRDGAREAGGFKTDAQQVFVSREAGSPNVKALVFGGGTFLTVGAFELRRSTPGSALVEKTATGSYLVRNCGSDAAKISGSLGKMFAFELKPGETKEVFPEGGSATIQNLPWIGDGRPVRDGADWYAPDPAPVFVSEFILPDDYDVRQPVRVEIAAPVCCQLAVNGEPFTDASHLLFPLWTPFDKTIYSETVFCRVRPGLNTISVALGNGWYNMPPLLFWGTIPFRANLAHGRPCFKLAIDGVEKLDWTWHESCIVQNSYQLGETIDLRRAVDTTPKKALEIEGPKGRILPRLAPQVGPLDPRGTKGRAVWLKEGERQVVDFGANLAGLFAFNLDFTGLKAGDRVEIIYGERLNPDGSVNALTQAAGQIKKGNGGPGAPQVASQRDEIIVGDSSASMLFRNSFTWHIARYAEIRGVRRIVPADGAFLIPLGSQLVPVEPGRSFRSGHAALDRLHEVCLRTFRDNLLGVQSDCPGRERLQYGGDIVATCEALALNFDMKEFYLKVLKDFADEAEEDGWITETAPFVGIADSAGLEAGSDLQTVRSRRAGPVSWALAVPTLIDLILRRYPDASDRALAFYPVCRRYVKLMDAASPSGLVAHCIGDHEAIERAPDDCTASAHYHEFVRLTGSFACRLGLQDDEAEFTALAAKIRAAFQAKYVKDGIVANGSESAQALGLYLGLIPADQIPAAEEALRAAIRKAHFAPTTGIFTTRYMLLYLSEHGMTDLARRIVLHPDYPGWLHMLDRGATTLWETWKESDDIYSNCHPMFGSVDEWILKYERN